MNRPDHEAIAPGLTIGHVTVVAEAGRSGDRAQLWTVRCSCGAERTVKAQHIRKGSPCRACADRAIGTHHMTKSPEYKSWRGMRARCACKKQYWKNYGARGIAVCKRWQDSFEAFYADVGPRPGDGYSIDRIDNDRGYEPGNVRWATASEQQRNKQSERERPAMIARALELRHAGVKRAKIAEAMGISIRMVDILMREGRHGKGSNRRER